MSFRNTAENQRAQGASKKPCNSGSLGGGTRFCAALFLAVIALLSACGGGQNATNAQEARKETGVRVSAGTSSTQTTTLLKQGARLNQEELAMIQRMGVLPTAAYSPHVNASVAKSQAVRAPVFRFFNSRTNAHFFTTSPSERDTVRSTLPFMSFEGIAFQASGASVPGLSQVHRFYNTQTGVHFYTISEAERAHVTANLPQFTYEGVAYHASTLEGTGYVPLYRFFYASKGFHFYTNSLAERDQIVATLPQYQFEGIGYYVLGDDWRTPAIPHTGTLTNQCHAAGSDVLVACSSSGAIALNPQQDGHRTNIGALSYNSVGANPLTSCVMDNVTGLLWEGKTPTGFRSGGATYTNLGDGSPADASAYVAAVNASQLCGFNDWRMPTAEELYGIVNLGVTGAAGRIDASWFPNTAVATYWTGEPFYTSGTPVDPWYVDFSTGAVDLAVFYPKPTFMAVRLVRGAPWAGRRLVIGSTDYPGDGPNNTVLDRKSGLSWRRCYEGQTWDGSRCNGAPMEINHSAALVHARQTTGWRVPNIKELTTIVDRSRSSPAFDTSAFPGAGTLNVWASTPVPDASNYAWGLLPIYGIAGTFNSRAGDYYALRLVRIPQ